MKDWEFDTVFDGTLAVTCYSGSDSDITIPEEIDGKRVSCVMKLRQPFADSVETITVPDGIGVATHTFAGCAKLKKLIIKSGMNIVMRREFADCPELTSITLLGVKRIDTRAFEGASALTSLTLGRSVKEIWYKAFDDTSLTDIYYEGSEAEWKAIKKVRPGIGGIKIHYNCNIE